MRRDTVRSALVALVLVLSLGTGLAIADGASGQDNATDDDRVDETRSGQAIKQRLEDQHGEVLHGRLYANLDELVDTGLVVKSEIDGRTNRYTLTESARAILKESVKRLADACGMQVAATDGGRFE